MQGIEVLYWAISIVFCLALVFAILLWCRSWRKEEHEANTKQVQLLAREIRRLREAIELLDHTASSMQTADEQLSGHLEILRETTRDLRRQMTRTKVSGGQQKAQDVSLAAEEPPIEAPISTANLAGEDDRFAQARALLQTGKDPVEVARELDLGNAEVRMIARMINDVDDTE